MENQYRADKCELHEKLKNSSRTCIFFFCYWRIHGIIQHSALLDIELDFELYPVAKYKLKEIPMISKEISIKIDKAIKEIWLKNIPKNFSEGFIINEDC